MKRYEPKELEPKWQKIWDESRVYKVDLNSDKPKYFAMSMFNYPSGAGIHIGHAMNYTISDVKSRFYRQLGHESYHPIGWDAFGLPAENYAIKAGVSPQESMANIIPGYHKQYKAMGWSNDWSKEIATHEPDYYKWTQWIFAQMYKNGLAYQDSRMQWWCTKCQTVLANEQVIDGKCWRHDGSDDLIVEQKEVKQWFFKITEYADELLEAIDDLDWTESVKLAQKNWIGRSVGAEVQFAVESSDKLITVFTTRPDTLFGATFIVLAPEHDLVSELTAHDNKQQIAEYIKTTQFKTEVERQASKEKTGVFTGSYAINPVNNEKIPIWIADYVLTGYGTGAIMAVPAHDERDNEFARQYDLSIRQVVAEDFGASLEDAEDVEGAVVIVVDDSSKKFLGITTGTNPGLWLAGGGREPGENFEQTAIRELAEETGFSKYKSIVALGDPVYSYYFNDVKRVNRRSFGQGFLFVVDRQNQGVPESEPHEKFDLGWYEYDELVSGVKRVGDGVDNWLEMLDRAKRLIDGDDLIVFDGEGMMVNSGEFTGQASADARENIVKSLSERGLATEKVNYKMRDWSVSRQRYWGAPIPIIYCPKDGPVLVPEEQLPVVLPVLDDFKPSGDGRSALARATDWLNTTCPQCGGPAERETDTLDTYICSSWYMLRYLDPHNDERIFSKDIADKWMPVDFYNGGDHATAHLLYARFVTRFFTKLGLLDNPEPFKQMLFNGKVTASDGSAFSKSKGNGVDPLEIINSGYGADALRTYLMFAAPLELGAKWDPQGVPGTYRFLNRLWTLVQEYLELSEGEISDGVSKKLRKTTHSMIKKMTEDIRENRYNTAIASAMGNVNELYKLKVEEFTKNEVWQEALNSAVACIAPFAPHITDELWQQLGNSTSVQKDSWPSHVNEYIESDTISLAVQINGKLRSEIVVAIDATKEEILAIAQSDAKVSSYIAGKTILRQIYVPKKLVNFVV